LQAGYNATVIHVVLESQPVASIEGHKDVVYEFLHGSGAVCWAKWHNTGGIMTFCCFEGKYVLGFFFDCKVVIPFS